MWRLPLTLAFALWIIVWSSPARATAPVSSEPEPTPPPASEEAPEPQGPTATPPPPPSSTAPPSLLPGLDCSISEPSDPLFPVLQTFALLRSGDFELEDCQQLSTPLQGRRIELTIRGSAQALMLYVLEKLASGGFIVELTPTGTHEVRVVVRMSTVGGGVRYVRITA